MQTQFDQFAFQVAQAVNSARQTPGSDVNRSAGLPLFDPTITATGSAAGAASTIRISLTCGSQIEAAASRSPPIPPAPSTRATPPGRRHNEPSQPACIFAALSEAQGVAFHLRPV